MRLPANYSGLHTWTPLTLVVSGVSLCGSLAGQQGRREQRWPRRFTCLAGSPATGAKWAVRDSPACPTSSTQPGSSTASSATRRRPWREETGKSGRSLVWQSQRIILKLRRVFCSVLVPDWFMRWSCLIFSGFYSSAAPASGTPSWVAELEDYDERAHVWTLTRVLP